MTDDAPAPPPGRELLTAVVIEGKRRRSFRRRVQICALLAVLSLCGGVLVMSTRSGSGSSERLATGATPIRSATSSAETSGPTSAVSPDPSETTAPASITIDANALPEGWWSTDANIHSALAEGRPSLTIANYSFDTAPSPKCDLPVSAVEALGVDDALLSIRLASAGASYTGPRPSGEDLLPSAPPENAYVECFGRSDFLFTASGFHTDGVQYQVFVALGSSASSATKAEASMILDRVVL